MDGYRTKLKQVLSGMSMKVRDRLVFCMANAIIAQALLTAVLFSCLCTGHQDITGRHGSGFAYSEFRGRRPCILINNVRRADGWFHHIKRYAIHNENRKHTAQRFQAGEIRFLMVC